MSVQAVSWAIGQEIKSSAQKLVLICLANYADAEGVCFPGQKALAADASMTDRSVRTHLAALEKAGIISRRIRHRDGGRRTSDEFVLHINRKDFPVADRQPEEKRRDNRKKPSGPEPSGEPSDNNMGDARAKPRPLPEDWRPRPAEKQFAHDELNMTEAEFADAVKEFCEFWRSQGGRSYGRKTDWNGTFKNRLRQLGKQWGTIYRRPSGPPQSGGQRRGASSLADIAARSLSRSDH